MRQLQFRDEQPVLFVDECTVSVLNTFKQGKRWQPFGITFEVPKPDIASELEGSVLIFVAVSVALDKGCYVHIADKLDLNAYLKFLQCVKERIKEENQNDQLLVVNDNAPLHFSVEALRYIEAQGWQVQHTASYSPEVSLDSLP